MNPPPTEEQIVRRLVEELVPVCLRALRNQPAAVPAPLHMLTVDEFAFVLDRRPAFVRERIRARIIPREHVSREKPYKISPLALAKFGVPLEVADARLAEWRAQCALPSAA